MENTTKLINYGYLYNTLKSFCSKFIKRKNIPEEKVFESGITVQSHLTIPTSQPSSPVNGDIWIV